MSDQDANRPSATPEWHDQDEGADAASERSYEPSREQVNRARMQGVGMGEQELNVQRDPDRMITTEQYGSSDDSGLDTSSEPGGGGANLQELQAREQAADKRGEQG